VIQRNPSPSKNTKTRVIALNLETAVEVVDEVIDAAVAVNVVTSVEVVNVEVVVEIDATAVEIVVSFKALVIVMMNVVLSVRK